MLSLIVLVIITANGKEFMTIGCDLKLEKSIVFEQVIITSRLILGIKMK